MRILARLFGIACVLLAIVTLVFLLVAVEGNAPPPIQRQYIHATLFAAIGLLASIPAFHPRYPRHPWSKPSSYPSHPS